MILASAKTGFRRAIRQPALATTLWLWSLLLAVVVAVPASTLFGAAFSLSPEADQLLDGFRLRFVEEATQYDRSPVGAVIRAIIVGLALLALLGNAFFAGGVLEVLVTDDTRPFLHRFMRGAGHFFWRFLRLLLLAAAAAGILALAVSLAAAPVTWLFAQSRSEWLQLLSSLLVPAAILVVLALVALALDYARIRMALDDGRSALRAWWGGVTFVVRRFVGAAGIGVIFGASLAALYLISLAYQLNAPSNTGLLIGVLILVQQATVWSRAALRVGSYAAALDYYGRYRPPAPAVADSLTVPGVPPVEEAMPADVPRDVTPA